MARPTVRPSSIVYLCDAQEIFGSYGEVTSVDLAVDKRVNLPKVKDNPTRSPFRVTTIVLLIVTVPYSCI